MYAVNKNTIINHLYRPKYYLTINIFFIHKSYEIVINCLDYIQYALKFELSRSLGTFQMVSVSYNGFTSAADNEGVWQEKRDNSYC